MFQVWPSRASSRARSTMPLGRALDEHHLAALGLHEQQLAHPQHLPLAVAALLPASLAVGQPHALENPVGEAVGMAAVDHDVGELGLEQARLPPDRRQRPADRRAGGRPKTAAPIP